MIVDTIAHSALWGMIFLITGSNPLRGPQVSHLHTDCSDGLAQVSRSISLSNSRNHDIDAAPYLDAVRPRETPDHDVDPSSHPRCGALMMLDTVRT
jgi:hypothetical protein